MGINARIIQEPFRKSSQLYALLEVRLSICITVPNKKPLKTGYYGGVVMADALQQPKPIRIQVFVDYWNFQLTLNELESKATGNPDSRVKIDWKKLGGWLAAKAAVTAGVANHSYEGVSIYTSFNPTTSEGKTFNNWAMTWLNRQAGVKVSCRERRAKHPPKCPTCYKSIETCPHKGCEKPIKGMVEKGVDTLIATDMIRLAWEDVATALSWPDAAHPRSIHL